MARVTPLRITLLGAAHVARDGRPLAFDTRKAVALLAYLAVAGRQRRDTLAALLWPDADEQRARGALRRTLSVLRSGVGGDVLSIERQSVELVPQRFEADVVRFRALLAEADAHLHEEPCDHCQRVLTAAVGLWHGSFLAGFGLRDSPEFDEWQAYEAESLRLDLAAALDRLIRVEATSGSIETALVHARRRLALDPLHEPAHRALMELHARNGDRGAAVRQYRECMRVLDDELAVPPLPETTALYEAIVAGVEQPEPSAPRGSRAADPTEEPPSESEHDPLVDAIAWLGPVAEQLLGAAAVIGEEFRAETLRAVAGRAEEEVVSAVEELVRRGLLREPSDPDGAPGYRFVDQRIRDHALGRLSRARLRLLHARVADALRQQAGRARITDPGVAALIAMHLAAAGREPEAADFHLQAADAARRAFANDHAIEHYRAALAFGISDVAAIHAAIGEVETIRGRYGQALTAFEFAAAHAKAAELPALEHRLGLLHLRTGEWSIARQHLAIALDSWPPLDHAARARIQTDLAFAAHRAGDLDGARRHADDSLRTATASREPIARAQAHNVRAILARAAGETTMAREELARAAGLAATAADPAVRVAILNNAALVERDAGDLDAAITWTDEALALCVAIGDRHREAALRNNLADLLHLLGRHPEARRALAESVTIFADIGEPGRMQPEIWKLVEW